ncbi:unnamed protein product [Heligmosomoides polygyrus]|uniref:Glucuronosyltransferase n=1 Tax=Heligmosomoides polygyrus TaxID=6339 RepID=A0A183GAQ5_HELPZ|nr:unnamed protein product [Heligmosomoides polygyrus]
MTTAFYGLLILAAVSSAYKIVLFAPDISNSQVGYNKRVSETLAKAGHDVTVVLVQTSEDPDKDVTFAKEIRVVPVNASSGLTKADLEEFQRLTVFGNVPMWHSAARKHFQQFMQSLIDGCRCQFLKATTSKAHHRIDAVLLCEGACGAISSTITPFSRSKMRDASQRAIQCTPLCFAFLLKHYVADVEDRNF